MVNIEQSLLSGYLRCETSSYGKAVLLSACNLSATSVKMARSSRAEELQAGSDGEPIKAREHVGQGSRDSHENQILRFVQFQGCCGSCIQSYTKHHTNSSDMVK